VRWVARGIDEIKTERDTLRTRVAELEEKLMVMCVAQLRQEAVAFHMTAGKTTFTKADVEAITALAVAAALKYGPSPDQPAPAPLAAQGVEGEPQHER